MATAVAEDKGLQAQRKLLPIYPARGQLLREFRANACCVVVGETGSGKTTQIPQVAVACCTVMTAEYLLAWPMIL